MFIGLPNALWTESFGCCCFNAWWPDVLFNYKVPAAIVCVPFVLFDRKTLFYRWQNNENCNSVRRTLQCDGDTIVSNIVSYSRCTEDGRSTLFRNIGIHLPNHTASHPTRQFIFAAVLWAGIAQSVQRLATSWTAWGSNPC